MAASPSCSLFCYRLSKTEDWTGARAVETYTYYMHGIIFNSCTSISTYLIYVKKTTLRALLKSCTFLCTQLNVYIILCTQNISTQVLYAISGWSNEDPFYYSNICYKLHNILFSSNLQFFKKYSTIPIIIYWNKANEVV